MKFFFVAFIGPKSRETAYRRYTLATRNMGDLAHAKIGERSELGGLF